MLNVRLPLLNPSSRLRAPWRPPRLRGSDSSQRHRRSQSDATTLLPPLQFALIRVHSRLTPLPIQNPKSKIQNPSPISQTRSAEFARGFFTFLESNQLRSAVLHGGEDGFERELSDVDFVVDYRTFPQLPGLIDAYCAQAGWQLCQVLRHETTAAYFVCSAADDPNCAVALDACSDYQRNGTVFLPADELLENIQPLAWGGHSLFPATELRYRFAKAAAKNKDAAAAAEEFTRYPEEIRRDCAAWLEERWNTTLKSWDAADLVPALAKLRARSNPRPSLLQAGALGRILSRILHPTGLIVIAGHHDFEATAARLESVFGHLYFRRFRKAGQFRPAHLMDLVASTLIVVPELAFPWSKLVPADCLHRMAADEDCRVIAARLHQRCKRRETR
jgi:hypothetical protein